MPETRILMVPSWQLVPRDRLSPRDTQIVCQAALELWQTGLFDLLLLTGGLFLPSYIQSKPSSELMKNWFVAQGVESTRIVTETRSLDTFENIAYSLTELRRLGISHPDITVCTQWQHAVRIRHTFKRAHGIEIQIYTLNFDLPPLEHARQWLYIAYHCYDTRGDKWLARTVRRRRGRAAIAAV